jgi:hypothetical protein
MNLKKMSKNAKTLPEDVSNGLEITCLLKTLGKIQRGCKLRW